MSKYIKETFVNFYGKESDKISTVISNTSKYLVEGILPVSINYLQSYFTRYGDDFIRKNNISSAEEFKEQAKHAIHEECKLLNNSIVEAALTFSGNDLAEYTNNVKTIISNMTESLLYDNDYDSYSLMNDKNSTIRNNLYKPLNESEKYELIRGSKYFKESIIDNAKEAIKNNKASITRVGGASAAGAGLIGGGIGIHNALRDGSNSLEKKHYDAMQNIGTPNKTILSQNAAVNNPDHVLNGLKKTTSQLQDDALSNGDRSKIGISMTDDIIKRSGKLPTGASLPKDYNVKGNQDSYADAMSDNLGDSFGRSVAQKSHEYGDHIKHIANATVDTIKNTHPALAGTAVLGLGLAAAAAHHYQKNKINLKIEATPKLGAKNQPA